MVSRGLTISHSLDDDSYWRLAMRNSVTPANCPPEPGGQHDRDSSRDRAGGGSRAALFKNAFWNISFGEPPLASSQRTRWRCPPDSGGQFVWLPFRISTPWPPDQNPHRVPGKASHTATEFAV